MADPEGGDRKSVAAPALIITDPGERAKKEASNALRQFDAVVELVEQARSERQGFKLRPSTLLSLNRFALEGINTFAGNYRPSAIVIIGSQHQPPPVSAVPGLVEELCEYVSENFGVASPLHLAAYVMWRVNWVHPFDDGNGRTARAASYLVLCVKLGGRLPGKPTIPDLIVDDKHSYYAALEAADAAWVGDGRIDLGALERLLENLLATQLVSALEEAKGQPIG
jgi:Fic family protein